MKRLRSLLGHARKADRRDWWIEHAEELRMARFTEFGEKYGVSGSAAEMMYVELFGERRGKGPSWWRDPETAAILLGNLPAVAIADQLGRTVKAVWNARYLLKSEGKQL